MFRQILSKTPRYVQTYKSNRLLSAAAGSSGSSKAEPPKSLNNADIPIVDFQDPDYIPLPEYPTRLNEPLHSRKQRLIYQSRKRGMLENDLLLSTFVHKYLESMSEEQVALYDQLINGVSNDWDIYYWATNTKPTPPEYNNEIMTMLKEHVKNTQKEVRCRQPDLF